MYEKLKSIALRILPSDFIRRNESTLRQFIAWRYRGSAFQCNLCHFEMRTFIQLANGDQICPRCGSLPRTRRLWHLMQGEVEDKELLHFSPSAPIRRQFAQASVSRYVTTDYEGEFEADKKLDITAMEELDASYDIV
ncbi:MAG: SAM-dependent methyltransferase, partial [Bacteroidota bacterium]